MKYGRLSRIAMSLTFLLAWILILTLTDAQHDASSHRAVVDVFKCPDSPLNISTEPWRIDLYNEELGVEVSLRQSREPFRGCASSLLPMEEISSTSITPHDVLTVDSQMYQREEYCLYNYKHRPGTPARTLTLKYCPLNCTDPAVRETTPCVKKCCPAGKVLNLHDEFGIRCLPTSQEWSPPMYDAKSWKELKPGVVKGHSFLHKLKPNCSMEPWLRGEFKFGLLTTGEIIYISGKRRWEKLGKEVDFCVDGVIGDNETFPRESDGRTWPDSEHVAFICGEALTPPEAVAESTIYMICLFIASSFYLLTALIHLILIDKQNVHGMTVFCLTLSQGLMGVFVGNSHRLGLQDNPEWRDHWWCQTNGILAHFFMLAAFTWLALINLNMWLTFRALMPRSSGKNLTRFLYYCIAGFGAPLVVVVIGIILNNSYPNAASLVIIPEYGHNTCFVADYAQGPYIYYLLAAIFVVIFFLFGTTCYTLWKFQKDTAGARKESSAKDRNMGILFLKMSIVLGVAWIFELISWAVTYDKQAWYWMIPDLYNLFTSIFVFYIFVFKDTMLLQLEQRLPFLSPITQCLLKCVTGETKEKASATASSNLQNSTSGQNNKVEMRDYSSIDKAKK